jgi:hypothetical protein
MFFLAHGGSIINVKALRAHSKRKTFCGSVTTLKNMTLPQQVEETELWQDLISHLFPIQSGEQLIGVINVTKLNRRKGRDSEQRILCLTVHRQDVRVRNSV